jgi:hypothetical protein
LASSSAMIRRMEAKISSIEGSCAFAGWLIAGTPQSSKDDYAGAESNESRHCGILYATGSRLWARIARKRGCEHL